MTRERTVQATVKTTVETAHHVSSDAQLHAPGAGHRIRRHWSVENELHWVLDQAFREDEARHSARYLAEDFASLRHFARNLIEHYPERRLGIAGTRKRAGWDHDCLLTALTSETRQPGPSRLAARGRGSWSRSRLAVAVTVAVAVAVAARGRCRGRG